MSNALLIRLSGDAEDAARILRAAFAAQDVTVSSLADVASFPFLNGRFGQLAIVGEPPSNEIGFGLLPFVALLCRAERVVTIDSGRQLVNVQSRRGFIARNLTSGVLQLTGSAGAIGLQRFLAEMLRKGGAPAQRVEHQELRRVLYLRPHVGVASGCWRIRDAYSRVIRALRDGRDPCRGCYTDTAIAMAATAEPVPPCTGDGERSHP